VDEADNSLVSAGWQRYIPVISNGPDWQAYKSFKGSWTDSDSKRIRFLNLAQLVRQSPRNGLVAECGCLKGHSTHLIATVMAQSGFGTTPLLVFDSFQGLSEPSEIDLQSSDLAAFMDDCKRSGKKPFGVELPTVMKNLREHKMIQFFEGWIPDRFQEVADRKFALVHIDVDLYEPTRDSLQFFYPRLLPGGAIQIDDYNFANWPGATVAVNEFLTEHKPSMFIQLPLGGAYLIK